MAAVTRRACAIIVRLYKLYALRQAINERAAPGLILH